MRIEKNNKTKGVLMSYKSIVNVSKSGNSYSATDVSGNNVTGISTRTLRKAFKAGSSLGLIETKTGKMATPWSKNHHRDDKIPPYKKKCTVAL